MLLFVSKTHLWLTQNPQHKNKNVWEGYKISLKKNENGELKLQKKQSFSDF